MMQYGRIAGHKATLYQLLQWMIIRFKAAHEGEACWHEAEYYAMQVRFKSIAYSSSPALVVMTGT